MITMPAMSAVLIVRGDRVVGQTVGAPAAARVPLTLAARAEQPAQAVPDSVVLAGCGARGGNALPPGRYTLVAVLGYQLDSLNAAADASVPPAAGGRSFALVSAPVPITVS
jgi:hypothetical protein